MLSKILFWVIAILMLSLLVLVHELGHFISGRLLKFKIMEFAIGFGPKLAKWERKGIKYSLRAFPLGGFVAFYGEDADKPDEPGAMNNMPWYKRIIVLASGVTCNLIFALLMVSLMFTFVGRGMPVVSAVVPNTPLSQTQLMAGDRILKVNGKEVLTTGHMYSLISEAGNQNVNILADRNGQLIDVTADKYKDDKGAMLLGLVPPNSIALKQNFFRSAEYSFKYNAWMAGEMYKVLGRLVTGKLDINELSGPVSTINGIGTILENTVKTDGISQGLLMALDLLVIISVNLAIFNILPIPALDGFRIVMVIIERIRKKPINRDLEAKINFAGFAVLIGLVLILELYKLVTSIT